MPMVMEMGVMEAGESFPQGMLWPGVPRKPTNSCTSGRIHVDVLLNLALHFLVPENTQAVSTLRAMMQRK